MLALNQVRTELNPGFKERLKGGVLSLIKSDRTHDRNNRSLISKLIHVMLALDLY